MAEVWFSEPLRHGPDIRADAALMPSSRISDASELAIAVLLLGRRAWSWPSRDVPGPFGFLPFQQRIAPSNHGIKQARRAVLVAAGDVPLMQGALKQKGSDVTSELPDGHVWQPEHLRLAVSAAGVALWAWNVDTDLLTMDARGFELWGMAWSDKVTFDELSSHIHPADRDRVRAAFMRPELSWGPMRRTFVS